MTTLSPARMALALGAMAGLVALVACGTNPVGVDACVKIEHARCESAPACGIELDRPLHSGSKPENAVAACERFYDDQCLHGLVVTTEPSPQAVDACVNAINTSDCSVVSKPELHPACSFLVPPTAAPADAGTDASVADAADSG